MKPGAWRKDLSYSTGGKILFFRGGIPTLGQKAGENEKRADATQGIGSLFISLSNELGNKQNETLPSLRLGGSNPSHLPFIRKGLNPNPRPFPSPGEGMQPVAFGDFFSPWQSRNKFHFAHLA